MIRKEIIVYGLVQGVGFRPFVYRLAKKLDLDGYVFNTKNGVKIQIQGGKKNINLFEQLLVDDIPLLAKIDNIEIKNIKTCHKGQFEIINSIKQSSLDSPLKLVSISPDIKLCIDCLFEINTLKYEKYYKYFAINCINCGPRYSIIQTVPYDRINTSMKIFSLCKSCHEDYKNPINRRYHAQPTSCKNCGPKLTLHSKCKVLSDDIFENISYLINSGKIGAIKGIGGFHIVCDALNDTVIKKLRVYKNRPSKPFAIMCKDIKQIELCTKITKKEKQIIASKEAPIVIVKKLQNPIILLSDEIAPNINRIGCMIAYSGFYHILFNHINAPIIATSANIGGEPIITTKDNIEKKLPFLDFIVDFNRDIVNAIDDSVVQLIDEDILTIRLSRGYAPKEIKLPFKIDKKILAVGANQKNQIALAFEDKIILSPYIGDLDNIQTVEFFNKTIETFKRFYDFEPDIIICDKHPQYESTKFAKQLKIKNLALKIIFIQHHLAHIYSVKAEYNLKYDYVGFVFDGTGYGDDKTLWGGEVFLGDKRKYSFKPMKLLGASKAIKEPKRVALSMLFNKYSLYEVLNLDLPTVKEFTSSEINLFYKAYIKNINSPITSSVGRYFDMVASISGVCQVQSYEGEAGLACEMAYDNRCKKSFTYSLDNNIIDIKFDFFDTQIVSKFINTLVKIIVDISTKEKLAIILSGGVFQNKILLELVCEALDKKNIKYYYNKTTPINDSGIALGQIWKYVNNL
jgi:hydrogenase maturation protein HypF